MLPSYYVFVLQKCRRSEAQPRNTSLCDEGEQGRSNDHKGERSSSAAPERMQTHSSESGQQSAKNLSSRADKSGTCKLSSPPPCANGPEQVKAPRPEGKRSTARHLKQASVNRARNAETSRKKPMEAPAGIADPLSRRLSKDRQRSSLRIFSGKASQALTDLKHARVAAYKTTAKPPRTAADSHKQTHHDSFGDEHGATDDGYGNLLSPGAPKHRCETSVALQKPPADELAEASVCQGAEPEQQELQGSANNVPHNQWFRELRARLRRRFCRVCDVPELDGDIGAKVDQAIARLQDNCPSVPRECSAVPSALLYRPSCIMNDVFLQQEALQPDFSLDNGSGCERVTEHIAKPGSSFGKLDELFQNSEDLEEADVNRSNWSPASCTPLKDPDLAELQSMVDFTEEADLTWMNNAESASDDFMGSPSLSMQTCSDARALSGDFDFDVGGPDGTDDWDSAQQSDEQAGGASWLLSNNTEVDATDMGDDSRDIQNFAQFCASLEQ